MTLIGLPMFSDCRAVGPDTNVECFALVGLLLLTTSLSNAVKNIKVVKIVRYELIVCQNEARHIR